MENSERDGNTRPPDLPLEKPVYTGQEATVRTGHGTTDWFQIGKGVRQSCILSPCLFNLYAHRGMGASRSFPLLFRRSFNCLVTKSYELSDRGCFPQPPSFTYRQQK